MANDKTEKATPKKREEARKKGQVAKSARPQRRRRPARRAARAVGLRARRWSQRIEDVDAARPRARRARPTSSSREGIGPILARVRPARRALRRARRSPSSACSPASSSTSLQVGIKPHARRAQARPQEAQPDLGRRRTLRPARGLRGGKTSPRSRVVGAIAALALFPKLDELAALVGMPPARPAAELADRRLHIAQRAAVAYLLIALADYVWQRYRHEKSLKMDKQEVKDEYKQAELPPRSKGQQRRRAHGARPRAHDGRGARRPTSWSPTRPTTPSRCATTSAPLAPIVVAKGQDHVALQDPRARPRAGVPSCPTRRSRARCTPPSRSAR